MLYIITHKTKYDYGDVVPECFNIVRLSPRRIADQVCEEHELEIVPEPTERVKRTDYFGNQLEHFSIDSPHSSLEVTARTRIKVTSRKIPDPVTSPAWETVVVPNSHAQMDLLSVQLAFDSLHVHSQPVFAEYAKVSFTPQRPVMQALIELTERIHEDFDFDPEATIVSTPVEEVFEKKAGVCQDFAHLQIACLRSLNLPARYVSGYLRTYPPPGKPRLVGADASHAWVGAYCGSEIGWVDFDPTNNVIPSLDHVTIGWGRDYADVCPIQGVFTGGGKTLMHVSVDVNPKP
jgi:transglutaminase-like putative cysteine protease